MCLPPISILGNVDHFLHLGNRLPNKVNVEGGIQDQLSRTSTACGCLREWALENDNIRLKSKLMVYSAVVVTNIAVLGPERRTKCWKSVRYREKYNQHCRREILGIKPDGRRTYIEFHITSIKAMLIKQWLCWYRYLARMPNLRLPLEVLMSAKEQGLLESQSKLLKDVLKSNLKSALSGVPSGKQNLLTIQVKGSASLRAQLISKCLGNRTSMTCNSSTRIVEPPKLHPIPHNVHMVWQNPWFSHRIDKSHDKTSITITKAE